MVLCCTSLLLCLLIAAAVQVHAQSPSTEGFISIDCGATDNYTESTTGIPYTTDAQFIDTGANYNIASDYIYPEISKQYTTVRSFPDGVRNCYILKPVIQGHKYLIRASFMYGNYDKLHNAQTNSPLLFDLHIGVNKWRRINISDASYPYAYEAMTVALADFLSVCLVKTGSSIPFISSLETRPLKSSIYSAANASQSIDFLGRRNLAEKTDKFIRYPDDPYDRLWPPEADQQWVPLSTTFNITYSSDDAFEPPAAVLRTAAAGAAAEGSMYVYWDPDPGAVLPEYYINLHFCELELLSGKDVREFNFYLNDEEVYDHFRPPYLKSQSVYSVAPFRFYSRYNFTLKATTNATLPPILNAVEVYSIVHHLEVTTDLGDADAVLAIKAQYQVKKNWMGDPCSPKIYAWDGLNCSYIAAALRIVAVNLSSSGLVGTISTSFSMFTAIKSLDLSYNNLSGKVPDFIANMTSLQVLNLTGNCFSYIPDALLNKSHAGSLILRTGNKCDDGLSPETITKQKLTTPVIVIISAVPMLLLALVVSIVLILKRRQQVLVPDAPVRPPVEEFPARKIDLEDCKVQLESKQFTFLQLENITNKFTRVIGQGGFGTVYHGYVGSTEVAVKLLSGWSSQGLKEFLAETQNLRKVNHKNLVSLVGYCNDGEHMALIYEYMSQGSLLDHLRGKIDLARPLSWRERLQIVLEAAKGLDYLHKGCNLPIIHRDVKTSNILLDQKLQAKIADFGLSKAVLNDAQYVSTVSLVGTPGYMDPAYQKTLKLSEKSDVYSFGVVLLEVITGEPPIVQGTGKTHIMERVKPKLDQGDIDKILDGSLRGRCDINSVWKVLELAMMCTMEYPAQRPAMDDVVMHLKESLALETARESSIKNQCNAGISTKEKYAFSNISSTFFPSAR